jgi:ubiquitin-protein ligase
VKVEDVASSLPALFALRGGADSSSSTSIVALLKSTIINALKLVIPKSFWPKSWKKKTGKSSKMMSKEHLEKSFAKGDTSARVQKELRSFMANPPDNCKLVVGSNIRSWVINIVGAEDTIYAGEKYKMKIVFPKDYPSKPPSVYFLKPTPKHVHVYSNGDICLNLLGRDWRPTMTAQTLVLSIMSMLASAKEKKMPQDNAAHADTEPGQQQQGWLYHDEKC